MASGWPPKFVRSKPTAAQRKPAALIRKPARSTKAFHSAAASKISESKSSHELQSYAVRSMQDQAFRFQISVEAPTRVQNLKWHGRLARAFAAPRDVRPVLRSKALDRSVLRVWSNRSLRSGCLAGVRAKQPERSDRLLQTLRTL